VSVELDVVRKDLVAACGEVRAGGAADATGVAGGVAGAKAGVGQDRATDPLVPAFVALPGSTEETAAVMRVAAGHRLAVMVRGGGSRLSWGTPAARCDLIIDLSGMSGVVEHAAGDLVAKMRAGTRMADVTAMLAQAGQEIALDVPGDASVGGIIGSGLAGPRRLRYGTPRDLLIGITIVRADGTIAKSGGKVVKNVAGYDLGKLFAGSEGTLGLITEATFRLHPLPAARAYVTTEYVAVSVACDAVAAAANSPLVPSAVELSRTGPGEPIRVGVLLEGSADGVKARSTRMAGLLGNGEVSAEPPGWWPAAPRAGAGDTLVRVSFWVSALSRVLDAIDAAAAAAGVSPMIEGSAGAGVLSVLVRSSAPSAPSPPPDAAIEANGAGRHKEDGRGGSAAIAEFVARVRSVVAGERGAVVVLTAPAAVRERLGGHGGMHGPVPGLALMRAVRDQFDPDHRLAPGRFPEGA
jgi:glycolate oxidase FAD binding subunit